ncbi:uncharacterized protein LOC131696154 [Topomyia yanbarensis]|uniref:uncharacterized protein LOC131696154 n=1 Tax=Topomyia yanbarensis TaxID=2498891 RepID=UPI00273BD2C4|nr:uncharacterized protein LOC131696154 [Topomyia yanbarensis]
MSGLERKIRNLKTRRRSIATSFNLIRRFVAEYNAERDVAEVPVRLEAIVSLWADFNTVQAELETTDESPDALEGYLKERAEFESSFYKIKGFLLQHVPATTTTVAPTPQINHTNRVKLPDVKLPIFEGKFETWLNFHDLFVSLVHSSTDLSSIQKFYYLRSSLGGEALKLIQTIPISATNYPVAWNLLVEHFQNPTVLKRNYVQTLFDFPTLRRESATDLHALVEQFEANVRVLNQLGEHTEYWDILLVHFLASRLDPVTRRDWEEHSAVHETISFRGLTDFIQRRVNVLQQVTTKPVEAQQQHQSQNKKPYQPRLGTHGAFQDHRSRKCIACSEEHTIYQCNTFARLPIDEKERLIKRNHLCCNCFRRGHFARECASESCCKKCKARHHTLLCTKTVPYAGNSSNNIAAGSNMATLPTSTNTSSNQRPVPTATVAHSGIISCNSQVPGRTKVILATAVIVLIDDAGKEHLARALLDSGSECCFATKRLYQMMKVKQTRVDLPIAGIGKSSATVKYQFQSLIKSRTSDFCASVDLLILPKVTIDLPSLTLDTTTWKIPDGITLADPAFNQPNAIDLVLGAEIFFDLFSIPGRIYLGDTFPLLINSVFGWVVSGKTSSDFVTYPALCNLAIIDDLQNKIEKFWAIEEDTGSSHYSLEETQCEEIFQQTVTRGNEGRYTVRLPFKDGQIERLGENRKTALHRFRLLENRLSRNPDLGSQYQEFMTEYLRLGHMAPVPDDAHDSRSCYYLPHHPVVKDSSTTTKVCVVYDASCKTSTGLSLNDILLVGPVIQEDLRSLIVRARLHPIILIADVEKMYRQIILHSDDTHFQRVFWRTSPTKPIETFELKTVTYGTASAPFLATRVLKQLAIDEAHKYPIAAKAVETDFYVDDLYSGAATVEEAIELRKQLDSLLSAGGFQLRKWASNNAAVLDGVSPENRAIQEQLDFDRDQTLKTLGLYWEPRSDCLKYQIQLPLSHTARLTKRITLSYIAQIFDPLGLVGPVVVTAKTFMQTLWSLTDENGYIWEWDRELPPHLHEQWVTYHSELSSLNQLRIDRFVLIQNAVKVELHMFSDASERAYGSCAYLRSVDINGNIKVALLTSRSKVAPLKKQSIPRLELCGALLSAELYGKIISSLRMAVDTYFWTDSTIVISWLQATPSTWTTFVANRVSKIQHATQNCTWRHISGHENPADILSRGCSAPELLTSMRWWNGPSWANSCTEKWPQQRLVNDAGGNIDLERRKPPITAASTSVSSSFIDEYCSRFSSYSRMIRVTTYLLRYIKNLQLQREKRITSWLTTDELKSAEYTLIRLVQQQCFSDEWKRLSKGEHVSGSSRLRWFHPLIPESDKVIRIGGRLGQSCQSYDFKHQILLPSSHALTRLLLLSYHHRLLHAAPQLMINTVRLRYWPLGGRNIARQIVHKCITCVRARPKLIQQFMAELPASRVIASRPFSMVGVDFWGPVRIQPRHRRDAPLKAYVAVFVCFATKAVHLELVVDLSTSKFLQAFRRFVARRGLCSDVYSDNGRNFVGTANELRRFVQGKEYKDKFSGECNDHGIRWHFNPPKASHFGGLWEAAINSAQKHFHRVLS